MLRVTLFPEILQQVLVKFLYTWFQCKNLRVWEYIYSIRFIHYSKINRQLKIKFWVIAMDKVETFEMQPTKPWIKANLSCKAWIIFHIVLAILENVGSQEHCFEKYFKDYFLKNDYTLKWTMAIWMLCRTQITRSSKSSVTLAPSDVF